MIPAASFDWEQSIDQQAAVTIKYSHVGLEVSLKQNETMFTKLPSNKSNYSFGPNSAWEQTQTVTETLRPFRAVTGRGLRGGEEERERERER